MRIAIIIFLFSYTLTFAQKDFKFFYDLGINNYNQKNYLEATDEFSKAIDNKKNAESNYSIANAYQYRALCHYNLKNFKTALKDISLAIQLKPEYSELFYTKSLIHLGNKQYDECIISANKGLELKPSYEELIILKIRANLSKKNFELAELQADSLITNLNANNIDALCLKGSIGIRLKKYQNSIEIFNKVLELDPQNYNTYNSRGVAYGDLKQYDLALKDFERAMAIDSSYRWVGLNNIAFFINFKKKEYNTAIDLFDKAIKLNPDFAYSYSNRAFAKLKLKDLEGSQKDIEKSLTIDKENSYAFKTYGLLLIEQNKPKLACEKFARAIELGYSDQYDDEVQELINTHCK